MIYLFIFLGLFLGLNLVSENLIIFIIISALALGFGYWRFKKKVAIAYLVALAIGIALSFLNLKLNASAGTYTGVVIISRENYFIVWCKFERLIVYESNNNKEVGDIIRFTGKIKDLVDTSLESEFSFTNYLKCAGVTRELVVSDSEMIFANFIKLKAYKLIFLNRFDANARDYIDAFLFNVKNYDNSSIALASSLSIVYLFSSSGIYLNLLLGALEYLLFLRFSRRQSKIGALALLSWYLIFVLNKIGVRRILYIKILSLVNEKQLKKKFSYIEIISLVGTGMLVINRYLARQSGFYLGFMLSLILVFTRNVLSSDKKIISRLKMSGFVFLFMLPVSLFTSHAFHPLALLFQVILMPLTILFSLSGVVSFYLYPIKPYFNFLASGLDYSLKGFAFVDVAIPFKESSVYFLLIYYLLLVTIVYFAESYQKKTEHIFVVTLISLMMFKAIPYEYLYANSIAFLNVGQGDSAVIRSRNKTVMVDTGGLTYKDIATSVTIPYLHKKGVYLIDYIFISHADYDHTGALSSLEEHFKVKEVIDTSSPFKITINDLVIENLNQWASEASDENDRSQVLLFTVAHRRVLMMGDASTKIENYLMSEYPDGLDIDILKLGHHGSKTSSSYEFLRWVNPEVAIISVGKNNRYGHPNKEVLESLTSLKIKYLRTDEVGSISYYGNNFLRA